MGTSQKILVVDDDRDYVAGIRYVLEAKQYEVVAAYDAEEGLLKARDAHPDIILLDIMMGKGAEGILFARKVRHDPEYGACAGIPILVLTSMREKTGFWFTNEPKHPVFFPIDEIVEKPVKPADLLEKIRRMLAADKTPT